MEYVVYYEQNGRPTFATFPTFKTAFAFGLRLAEHGVDVEYLDTYTPILANVPDFVPVYLEDPA